MKYLIAICLFLCFTKADAQTGHFDDFADIANWVPATGYTLTNPGNVEMQIAASAVGLSYQTIAYSFPTLNVSASPFIQVKLRTPNSTNVRVRIDFQDAAGKVTNTTPVSVTIPGNSSAYSWYTFDVTGKFSQTYPAAATVDPTQVNKILVYIMPGGNNGANYTGNVFMDSLRIGSEAVIAPPPTDIKLNQIGFYTNSYKTAIGAQITGNSFYIVSSDKQDTLYTGTFGAATAYALSGETVKKADFTNFTTEGTFYITADNIYSPSFKIAPNVHLGVAKGLLKSYYFNRASMAIVAPWAENWARPFAHADTKILVHSSAATATRPAGFEFSSPRGWYDAGDYNKYMVNSGISTYTILALYEHYPTFFDTLNTFIPESGNNLPDILDEALWNLRWMLSAQDPNDGSVYHKVTEANFSGNVMPQTVTSTRYGVQRSTAAALDFAAVMAQAARIFRDFETELPQFADSCLNASIKAYNWALANPAEIVSGNPAGVGTGTYANGTVTDELSWARMELYVTTRDDAYYNKSSVVSGTFGIPGWGDVNTLGLISLVNYRKQLNTAGYLDTTAMKNKLLGAVDYLRDHAITGSAYGTAMGQGSWNFTWGSNAVAGNMGLLLLQAYRLTGQVNYLRAALSNLDYVLGRNGSGYSYVTGYGSKTPMNPHHRISFADGKTAPVPGMVVGGANPGQQDNCSGYASSQPSRSYSDTYCSYATNEPAINYTAPVAYMAGAIEAIRAGASYTPPFTAPPVTAIKDRHATLAVSLYPNPSKGEITVEFENAGSAKISIADLTGKVVNEETVTGNSSVSLTYNLEELPQGVYTVTISNEKGTAIRKVVKH